MCILLNQSSYCALMYCSSGFPLTISSRLPLATVEDTTYVHIYLISQVIVQCYIAYYSV